VPSLLAREGRTVAAGPPLNLSTDRERAAQLQALENREVTLSTQDFLALDAEQAELLVHRRYDALQAAGCDAEAAVIVAWYPEVEVGEAVRLIRHGFDPRTVVAILL